jgi:hypothetical protein
VDIKSLERGASQYYSKIVFIMSNVEDGTQDRKMTLFGTTVNKVASRKECAHSENFKFPFHSGVFSITFDFKCVLNILLL